MNPKHWIALASLVAPNVAAIVVALAGNTDAAVACSLVGMIVGGIMGFILLLMVDE